MLNPHKQAFLLGSCGYSRERILRVLLHNSQFMGVTTEIENAIALGQEMMSSESLYRQEIEESNLDAIKRIQTRLRRHSQNLHLQPLTSKVVNFDKKASIF